MKHKLAISLISVLSVGGIVVGQFAVAGGQPAAPSNLTAQSSATSASISLSWKDNSNNESGFKIERSTDNVNFSQINTIGANVTNYTDPGLANGAYYYRVRTFNKRGNSNYSNTARADLIAAPSNLTIGTVTANPLYGSSTQTWNVPLSWTDNSSNETAFIIERGTDGVNFFQIDTIGANVTNYTDFISATGTYYYRVRAANDFGKSLYSNPASTPVP